MPRARNSFVLGVVGASIVLSMAAVDVGPALAADTGTGVPATDTSVRYQVRRGDSLSSIARVATASPWARSRRRTTSRTPT